MSFFCEVQSFATISFRDSKMSHKMSHIPRIDSFTVSKFGKIKQNSQSFWNLIPLRQQVFNLKWKESGS